MLKMIILFSGLFVALASINLAKACDEHTSTPETKININL